MSIITLSQFKGGVGKTTCAVCLASLLHEQGPTLLIDSDPNRSASLWARKGFLPFTVCNEQEAPKLLMQGNFVNIIIDTPARPAKDEIDSLAKGCDLLILPSTPDPLSLSALAQIAESLPSETNYRILLTIIPPSPQKDGEEAMDALKRHNLPVFKKMVRRYKAYIKAADLGKPVHEIQGGENAWNDWKALWKEIKDAV